jgi:hypothetical protein
MKRNIYFHLLKELGKDSKHPNKLTLKEYKFLNLKHKRVAGVL